MYIQKIVLTIFFAIWFSPIVFAQDINNNIAFAVHAKNKAGFEQTIPFQFVNGEIVITVHIKGKDYNFLFDTGAPTIISKDMVTELGIEELGEVKLSDGDKNSDQQKVYYVKTMQIGGINFTNAVCISVDMTDMSEQLCTKIDGVVGANTIRGCYWKINFTNNTLTLTNRLPEIAKTATILSFKEGPNGSPYIKLQCGDSLLDIEFDTGSNRPLTLNDSAWFNNPEARNTTMATVYGIVEQTVYKQLQSTEYMSIANNLQMGKVNFKNVLISARDMHNQVQTIGTVFMKDYEVLLDWKDHIIGLTPNNEVNESKPVKTIGLSVTRKNGKLFVANIWKGSKAEMAGIKPGDQVIAVNSRKTEKINLEDYCSLKNEIKNMQTITLKIKGNKINEEGITLDQYQVLK